MVTGRKEDVCAAKREILSAAEHFSQIRAQRKNNLTGVLTGPGPNSNIPGQTTIQVRVPYRVVGLVVGPKGATIKRIQQQTNTYIITPSRDKEPIFEVTGLPENVETARKEIEAHIAMRTGGAIDSNSPSGAGSMSLNGELDNGMDGFARNSPENGMAHNFNHNQNNQANNASSVFSALYNKSTDASNAFASAFGQQGQQGQQRDNLLLSPRSQDIFSFNLNGGSKFSDIYSFNSNGFGGNGSSGFGLYESDEGLGDSPTFDSLVNSSTANNTTTNNSSNNSSSMWPEFNSTAQRSFSSAISPLDGVRRSSSLGSDGPSSTSSISSGLGHNGSSSSPDATELMELHQHAPARRLSSDNALALSSGFANLTNAPQTSTSSSSSFAMVSGSGSSSSSSPTECMTMTSGFGSMNGGRNCTTAGMPKQPTAPRDCIVCFEGAITAALVPCGHNLFCMDCAKNVCKKAEPSCPVCHQSAVTAIRIFS